VRDCVNGVAILSPLAAVALARDPVVLPSTRNSSLNATNLLTEKD